MNDQVYEKILTAPEIKQRTDLLLELLCERDDVMGEIAEKKREIKESNVSLSRLDARIWFLRNEVRTGKTFVSRQAEMPFTEGPHLADANGDPVDDPRDAPPKRSRKRKPEPSFHGDGPVD